MAATTAPAAAPAAASLFPNITFFSCYNYSAESFDEFIETYSHFKKSGIRLILDIYYHTDNDDRLNKFIADENATNDHKIRITINTAYTEHSIFKSALYKNLQKYVQQHAKTLNEILPPERNFEKDNFLHIFFQHYKYEIIAEYIKTYKFTSNDTIAYIDFRIYGDSTEKMVAHLRFLSKQNYFTSPETQNKIYFPCENENWGVVQDEEDHTTIYETLFKRPYWRFISGCFICNIKTYRLFYRRYTRIFNDELNLNGTMTWDFNLLSLVELNLTRLFFDDIDDTKIERYTTENNNYLQFPSHIYARQLPHITEEPLFFPYEIQGFYPSSCSQIVYNYKRYLNVRFVNYKIDETTGKYIFSGVGGGGDKIITKNYLCELITYQESFQQGFNPRVSNIRLVDDTHAKGSQFDNNISAGLEDIRLWEDHQRKVKYIASIREHNNKTSICVGDYDIDTAKIMNINVLQSPCDSFCEKNWIPFGVTSKKHNLYIYKWNPMQQYNEETQKLCKENPDCTTPKQYLPFFDKIRGSTVFKFIEERDCHGISRDSYIGVVHYSDETTPRQYYHILVKINAASNSIKQFSNPFYFGETPGIEFCISFELCNQQDYIFWVSRFDSMPTLFYVADKSIVWNDI